MPGNKARKTLELNDDNLSISWLLKLPIKSLKTLRKHFMKLWKEKLFSIQSHWHGKLLKQICQWICIYLNMIFHHQKNRLCKHIGRNQASQYSQRFDGKNSLDHNFWYLSKIEKFGIRPNHQHTPTCIEYLTKTWFFMYFVYAWVRSPSINCIHRHDQSHHMWILFPHLHKLVHFLWILGYIYK